MKKIFIIVFLFGLVNIAGAQSKGKTTSVYQTRYNEIISAIQEENHKEAIALLENLLKKPISQNKVYTESLIMELLASEYNIIDERAKYMKTLELGANKFPQSKYFLPNLINEYIREDNTDMAIAYLDRGMKNNSKRESEFITIKAMIYASQMKYIEAETFYEQALRKDPKYDRALDGLAILYILQAQDIKDLELKASNRKESQEYQVSANEYYQKSLPLLLKLKDIYSNPKASASDKRQVLIKLSNVYYNLNMVEEYEQTRKEMENLSD